MAKPKTNRPADFRAPAGALPPSAAAVYTRWAWLALCAATLIAYWPAMSGPYLFDDLSLDPLLPAPAPWTFFVRRAARAATNVSLLLDRWIWGMDPRAFHLVNLALHMLNGWLIWRILTRLLDRLGRPGVASRTAALSGAALFLLHPVQTEAVAYISSRSEVLCAFFAYSALAVYLGAEAGSFGWRRSLASATLLCLAILSKEPAVAMPAVFLLFDLFDSHQGGLRAVAKRWRLYAPLTAAAGALGVRLFLTLSREGTAGATGRAGSGEYLLTQFKVFWRYLQLIVLPVGQNMDHAFPLVRSHADAWAWLGLAGLAGLVVLAWKWRRNFPLAFFGLLTFIVLLAPTSSIVPIDDAMAERRLYLGSAGISMIAAEVLSRRRPAAPLYATLAAILILLGGLTLRRASLYTSAEAMWKDSVSANPANGRAHFQLAFACYEQGKCREALPEYELAAHHGGQDYRLLVDWALALGCVGEHDKAIERLRRAVTLKRHSHAWSVMGMSLAKQGKLDEAMKALNQALEIDPGDGTALGYRGNVHMLQRDPAAALADYDAALRVNPDDTPAIKGRRAAQAALQAAR